MILRLATVCLSALFLLPGSAGAPPLLDQRLHDTIEELLEAYGRFKGYPEKTGPAIAKRLGEDRRMVLYAFHCEDTYADATCP